MPSGMLQIKIEDLELGRLYYKACDFDLAIQSLEQALIKKEKQQDWAAWSQMLFFLMRMRAERLEFEELNRLREKALQVCETQGLSGLSCLDYVSGISEIYAGALDPAERCFTQALKHSGTQREMAQAVFGQAAVRSQRGDFAGTRELLSQFDQILGEEGFRDLRIAGLLLNVVCHREEGQADEALALLEKAEGLCQLDQNLYMVINAIFMRATVHQKAGRFEKALETFDLCEKLLREKDLKHLKKQIEQRRELIRKARESDQPVVELFSGPQARLRSPDRGEVDCSGQHLLLRLLSFLAERPGDVKTKEMIVQTLWGEEYHPLRHDNKVYVTVRRLRKLLEKNVENPRILLKGPEGYFFNPAIGYRVVENKESA